MKKARFGLKEQIKAYLTHFYTASGVVLAVLVAKEIIAQDYPTACLWLMIAMAIDSTDGYLARRYRVREVLPSIDGRKLDDIVDYLNYTFLPIILIAEAGRLPEPVLLWASVPLVTSLFAFCNRGIKTEEAGFFVGFPSYWNVVAVYVVLWLHDSDVLLIGLIVLAFSILTVLPLRFIYPSHAPRWKQQIAGGAIVWLVTICFMLLRHPEVPTWLIYASLTYPALYILLSLYLDLESR